LVSRPTRAGTRSPLKRACCCPRIVLAPIAQWDGRMITTRHAWLLFERPSCCGAPLCRGEPHVTSNRADLLHGALWHLHHAGWQHTLACCEYGVSCRPITAFCLCRSDGGTLSLDPGARFLDTSGGLLCRLCEADASSEIAGAPLREGAGGERNLDKIG